MDSDGPAAELKQAQAQATQEAGDRAELQRQLAAAQGAIQKLTEENARLRSGVDRADKLAGVVDKLLEPGALERLNKAAQ